MLWNPKTTKYESAKEVMAQFDFQTTSLLVSTGFGRRLGPAIMRSTVGGANMSGFLGVLGGGEQLGTLAF